MKDGVVDETPLEKEEHSYFRTQVVRWLFLFSATARSAITVVGQLTRHASAIRFLSTTRDTKLELFPKGRLVLSAVADAERRSVTSCVVLLAGCCVASWSRTQASYALSRCGSELYVMGSAAVEVLGVRAFLVEQGFSKEPPVVWGRQFVGSAVGTSSGNGSFGACGSETVSDTVTGLNGTFAGAESAQCGECGVLTKHVSRNTWETLCATLGLRTSVSRRRVIDPCAFLFSSDVDTALIMWIRKRQESQVIRQTSRRPDSLLIGLCVLQFQKLKV